METGSFREGRALPLDWQGTPIDTLLRWLDQTALAAFMRGSPWAYPLTEALHIMGLALLVGAAALFDLRLLGVTNAMPVTLAARHLLRAAHMGLALAALSGLLLFSAAPLEMAANTAFRLKLVLLGAAGLNALRFHLGPFRSVCTWDSHAPTPPGARIAALLSLGLWAGVIVCGRLIGYV
jgi:hypothetical protein